MLRKLPESMVVKGVTVEDYAPRDQVVDNFSDLYMIEWAAAFNHLKSTWADETNILATLFKIVKVSSLMKLVDTIINKSRVTVCVRCINRPCHIRAFSKAMYPYSMKILSKTVKLLYLVFWSHLFCFYMHLMRVK